MNGRNRYMELDDFKNIGKTKSTPEFSGDILNNQPMETFIEELKALDLRERKKNRSFIIIFGMFVMIYSGSFGLHQGAMKTGFSLIILGFILVLGYTYWRYRRIKDVDYTAPTRVFLRDAEHRYQYMTPIDWLITIPMLFVFTLGGSIVVQSTFTRYFGTSFIPLFSYLGVMVIAIIIGFLAGYKNWQKDKGWMLKKIRELKREFGA